MNKRFFLVLFITVISITFFSCKKTEVSSDEQEPEDFLESSEFSNINLSADRPFTAYTMERIAVLHTINAVNEQLPGLPFGTNAHMEHLNDPLTLINVPDGGIPDGPTAVVGSDVCLFYPANGISSQAELQNLPTGEPIPFATIIPLGRHCKPPPSDSRVS